MNRKLLVGAGIFAAIMAAAALALPVAARWQVEKALRQAASRWGLFVRHARVRVGFSRIEITGLHLEAPGFSLHVRKAALPEYRITRWVQPALRAQTVVLEGLVAEGDVPARLLDMAKRRESGGGAGGRLDWKELDIRGLALDIHAFDAGLAVQDGNFHLVRGGDGRGTFSKIQLRSRRLPVSFVDTAEVETQGMHAVSRMTLSGLVWPFSKDFELYAEKAALTPQSRDILEFSVEGHFLPERGLLKANGVYDRKTGKLVSHLQMQDAWVGLSIPNRLPVVNRENVRFSGKVDLTRENGITDLTAEGRLRGLTVHDPRIAQEPLSNMDFAFSIAARHDAERRLLNIASASFRVGKLAVQAEAEAVFPPQGKKPHVQAAIRIPPIPCQDALSGLPPALVPNLRRMILGGRFEGRLKIDVDFERIHQEEAKLSGKIDLDGCRVLSAPPNLRAERMLHDFSFSVMEPGGQRIVVEVAQDNENTWKLEEISPYMVSAVLTTEDASFWRHRGFITSEFATALTRNLRAGRFRYGASSITMQIVKNVFLERRKTLSRKFEELFYTWYVEQVVPKTRLMEVYLNIIELGPGIYGVGRASQHFFNKTPAELTPREAIYLASLLPSPKKRYAFFCNQSVPESWERALDRLLAIMLKRGHITQDEYQSATAQRIVFDVSEHPGRSACMGIIRRFQGN